VIESPEIDLIGRFKTGYGWEKVIDGRPEMKKGRGWASCPPRDMEEFGRFVSETVQHYRGQIRYWQLLDEPHIPWKFRGSPEEYVEMLGTLSTAVKKDVPNGRVLNGSYQLRWLIPLALRDLIKDGNSEEAIRLYQSTYMRSSIASKHEFPSVDNIAELKKVLKSDLAKYAIKFCEILLTTGRDSFDIFCFHDHMTYDTPNTYDVVTQAALDLLKRYGVTETMYLTGVGQDKNQSPSDQARAVPIRIAASFAKGIDYVLWWSFVDIEGPDSVNPRSGLYHDDGQPKPASVTFSTLAHKMQEIQFTRASFLPVSNAKAVLFQGGKGEFVIAWRESGTRRSRIPLSGTSATVTTLVPVGTQTELRRSEVSIRSGSVFVSVNADPILIASRDRKEYAGQ